MFPSVLVSDDFSTNRMQPFVSGDISAGAFEVAYVAAQLLDIDFCSSRRAANDDDGTLSLGEQPARYQPDACSRNRGEHQEMRRETLDLDTIFRCDVAHIFSFLLIGSFMFAALNADKNQVRLLVSSMQKFDSVSKVITRDRLIQDAPPDGAPAANDISSPTPLSGDH
jgi:hypothetical protein